MFFGCAVGVVGVVGVGVGIVGVVAVGGIVEIIE